MIVLAVMKRGLVAGMSLRMVLHSAVSVHCLRVLISVRLLNELKNLGS